MVIPFGLLAWFGVKVASEERLAARERDRAVTEAYLDETSRSLLSLLSSRKDSFLAQREVLNTDATRIREWFRTSPFFSGILVQDLKGKILFPPVSGPLSEQENRFLERVRDIAAKQMLSPRAISESGEDSAAGTGRWFPYHWDDGLHLLLVTQNGDFVRSAELDRTRLIADLIGLLPGGASRGATYGWCALLDTNGDSIYQWGGDSTTELRIEKTLPAPLGAWRMRCTVSSIHTVGSSSFFLIALALGSLALALTLGGFGIVTSYRRALREASERTTFVNQISHEIKTPLTNIRMYGELLARDTESDDRLSQFAKIIVNESQRLSRLIGNVLTFAKKEKGNIQIRSSVCRAGEVVSQVAETMEPLLVARGVEVNVSVTTPDTVIVDRDILEQIVWNLLSNVEKYAAPGKAYVTVAVEDGALVVRIRDEGPGIPAPERERIFDEYYRISNRLTDGVSGAGIGLSLSRDLARLHGGDLRLLPSERGALFELRLPANLS